MFALISSIFASKAEFLIGNIFTAVPPTMTHVLLIVRQQASVPIKYVLLACSSNTLISSSPVNAFTGFIDPNLGFIDGFNMHNQGPFGRYCKICKTMFLYRRSDLFKLRLFCNIIGSCNFTAQRHDFFPLLLQCKPEIGWITRQRNKEV